MALPVKMAKDIGVMEYWSNEVLEKAKPPNYILKSLCIAPSLHHSITPTNYPHEVKTVKVASGGGMKPPRPRILY